MIDELAKVSKWMEPHRNDARGHAMVGHQSYDGKYMVAIGVFNSYNKQLEISEELFNLYRAAHHSKQALKLIGEIFCTDLLELSEIAAWFESMHRYLVVDQLITELP